MIRRFAFLVLCAALVAGCSNSSFIGRQYDNFTAYYNTFHNAQKAFDEGVESIEQRNQPVDRERYLDVFSVPDENAGGEAFDRAIEKSADVLREHPNSKWVDDALMLIGKSYFYQSNHVGAEQKFREVIALDSELEGEARFWLARALVAAERYDSAAEHLRASLSTDEDFGRWADLMYLARGELLVSRSNWSAAAEALSRGLEGDVDSDVAARAAFLLGQVRETLGEYEAATAAYEEAASYRPRYELRYAARLNVIRMKGLHGQPEVALQELREMETDDKNYEKRAELRLLRGQLYQTEGRFDEAQAVYRDLLYGDDATRGNVSGRVHYALGELHRDAFENYTIAAAHFDTASTSIGRSGPGSSEQNDEAWAPAAITDSRQQANVFGEVAERAQMVSRLDSLLQLGQMENEEFQSFIAELREKRAREQAAQEQQRREQQASRQFQQRGETTTRGDASDDPESTTAAAIAQDSDAGFLFHNDPVRVQESLGRFEQQWGTRPLVPNWRRRTAVRVHIESDDDASEDAVPTAVDSIAEEQQVAAAGGTGPAAGQSLVDVSDVPRDSASRAEMQANRAVARYELGNALFLSVGRPDSAITWYRRVIEEDSDHPVAQRALYALAEAHAARGDTTQAQEVYRRVIEQYPSSDFADRAREQLGQGTRVRSTATDTTALAETAYASAYDAWQQNRHNEALRQMVRLVEQYPRTDIAPRALLAAGSIFMEQRPPDSLTATTPLPEVFASILEAQPKTTAAPDSANQRTSPPDTARTRNGPAPSDTSATPASAAPDTIRRSPAPPDTANATSGPDSVAAPSAADSMATRSAPDSGTARAAADTVASQPAAGVQVADSVGADSSAAGISAPPSTAADSLMQIAEIVRQVTADSTADSPRPVLRTLFAHITQQYPQSPQADRAERLLEALDESSEAAASPDPSAAPVDSVATDSARTSASRDSVAADSVATSPADTAKATSEDDAAILPPPSPRADTAHTDTSRADTSAAGEQPLPTPRATPRSEDEEAPPDTSSALPGPAAPPDSTEQERRN